MAVYRTDDGAIYRTKKKSGLQGELLEAGNAFVVEADTLAVGRLGDEPDSGSLLLRDAAGTRTIATGLLGPHGLALDEADVFFVTGGSFFNGGVHAVARAGGTVVTLASVCDGCARPRIVATDASNVYYVRGVENSRFGLFCHHRSPRVPESAESPVPGLRG